MKTTRKRRAKIFASAYGKRITAAIAIFILYIFLCLVSGLLAIYYIPFKNEDLAGGIIFAVTFCLFLGGSAAMLFAVIPNLKKAQAKKDFLRHDFSPYVSENDKEIFSCEIPVKRYVITASPFVGDNEGGEDLLKSQAELDEYFERFAPERLISEESFDEDFPPFCIKYYIDSDEINYRAVNMTNQGRTIIDIYDVHKAEFTADGVEVGGVVYPYDSTEAIVATGFGESTAFSVKVRIILGFERGYMSFEFSSRIAAVIERFGIKVNNRKTFDYVLSNPLKAFEQTARQLVLKKLK